MILRNGSSPDGRDAAAARGAAPKPQAGEQSRAGPDHREGPDAPSLCLLSLPEIDSRRHEREVFGRRAVLIDVGILDLGALENVVRL